MKIITALIITTTAALWVTGCGQNKESDPKADANTQDKDAIIKELRTELLQAKGRVNITPSEPEAAEAPVKLETVTDANGLIAKLRDDSTTGADVKSQRRVIHYFESLVDGGNDSVTAIASFLEQDLNKPFGRQSLRQQFSITSDQMEEMRASTRSQWEELGPKMRELGEKLRGQDLSREERTAQFRALFEPMIEKQKEMLTPEQRTKLDEMGEEGQRDFFRNLLGGGRGGGDRGRGGGDRGRGPGGR